MNIGGFQKTSLIDYPGKICSIIFTQGCNFRCPYCHNPELVNPELFQNKLDVNEIFEYLDSRKNNIDAVTITGGEPTLQFDLINFIQKIKEKGFLVKLDSNGTNPNVLSELFEKDLIDYIAMDIKAPLKKYNSITNTKVNIENIKKSIDLIMHKAKDYEFRTTIVNKMLSDNDIIEIGQEINGAKNYYFQNFRVSKLLDESYECERPFDDDDILDLRDKLEQYITNCYIR